MWLNTFCWCWQSVLTLLWWGIVADYSNLSWGVRCLSSCCWTFDYFTLVLDCGLTFLWWRDTVPNFLCCLKVRLLPSADVILVMWLEATKQNYVGIFIIRYHIIFDSYSLTIWYNGILWKLVSFPNTLLYQQIFTKLINLWYSKLQVWYM